MRLRLRGWEQRQYEQQLLLLLLQQHQQQQPSREQEYIFRPRVFVVLRQPPMHAPPVAAARTKEATIQLCRQERC